MTSYCTYCITKGFSKGNLYRDVAITIWCARWGRKNCYKEREKRDHLRPSSRHTHFLGCAVSRKPDNKNSLLWSHMYWQFNAMTAVQHNQVCQHTHRGCGLWSDHGILSTSFLGFLGDFDKSSPPYLNYMYKLFLWILYACTCQCYSPRGGDFLTP